MVAVSFWHPPTFHDIALPVFPVRLSGSANARIFDTTVHRSWLESHYACASFPPCVVLYC